MDIIETILTLILLFLSASGIIFSISGDGEQLGAGDGPSISVMDLSQDLDAPINGIQPIVRYLLEWLAYVGIIAGTSISFLTVFNEVFEKIYIWYLNRSGLLSKDNQGTSTFIGRRSRPKTSTRHGAHRAVGLKFSQHLLAYSSSEHDADFDPVDMNVFYPISLHRYKLAFTKVPEERGAA